MAESWERSEEVGEVPGHASRQAADEPAALGRLFPHFVARVGGNPVRRLEELRAPRALAAWNEISGLDSSLEITRAAVVDAIFEAVGGLENQAVRHLLLRVKRDLHNDRPLKTSLLTKLESAEGLPKALVAGLALVQQQEARRKRQVTELEGAFEEELVAARRRFQEVVQDEDFRRGLLLSSRTLAAALPRYVRSPPDKAGAKVRQVERSLMRYFSRTVMKATPFGTLCTILPGRLISKQSSSWGSSGDSSVAPPVFEGDPGRKISRLRLNKALYGKILPFLVKRPEIRRHLHVELNPTLQDEGGSFLFLAATSGGEVFQRLSRNPVVELFVALLRRRGHVPLEELLQELCGHPDLEASREEAESFVDRLMEMGLLRFRIGIREQEVDWDGPLVDLLAPVEDEHAALVCLFVKRLRACVDAYPQASLEERRQLLDEAQDAVRAVFEGLEGKTPKELPPFYEDAGGEASLEVDLGSAGECLEEYIGLTNRLSYNRAEQANMRAFFERFYGSGAELAPGSTPVAGPVPLLRFYEDYYREHFKGHLEKQKGGGRTGSDKQERADGERLGDDQEGDEEAGEEQEKPKEENLSNPFGLELLDRLQWVRNAIQRHLQELWRANPDAEELVLSREDLAGFSAQVPPSRDPCRSASMFCQYIHGFAPDGGPALIADGFLVGYGKYFSRFLYLLPDELYDDLLTANRSLTDQDLAEICGDASFNANLHPPLLPWELSYPTGESGSADQQIPSSELGVEPDPNNPHRLRLVRRASGREVIPVDLGFLNPRMRPPLFQLLARFTPVANFGLEMPEHYGRPSEGSASRSSAPEKTPRDKTSREKPLPSGVRYRPRLTYRGRLVIARRSWTVPGAAFPGRLSSEGEAAYFLRLQRWRRRIGLPQEVFVRLNFLPSPPQLPAKGPVPEEPSKEEDSKAREKAEAEAIPQQNQVREHLYKPQYVDFANPLLVDLFSRLGENLTGFYLTFEERLPAREHLVRSEKERWATEFLFQVNFSEGEVRERGTSDERASDQ